MMKNKNKKGKLMKTKMKECVKSTENKTIMEAWNPPISWVRQKIELAGNLIGSVHFYLGK